MNFNSLKNNFVDSEVYVGDEALQSYIVRVYNYMMVSLGLTALVSYLAIRTDFIKLLFNVSSMGRVSYSLLGSVLLFSPILIILYMNFSKSIGAKGSKVGLFMISALEGLSVSILVLRAGVYTSFQAFLLTAILFGSMALYGATTKKNLLSFGSFLTMAVWGLVLVSLFSLFFGGVGIWFSYAVVLLFTGLVAYDTYMIKEVYANVGAYGEESDKVAVFCALNFYLDFINIFIHLLRILANERK